VCPISTHLSSSKECLGSKYSRYSGSSNAVLASSKSIPCFARFSACLSSSHSNRGSFTVVSEKKDAPRRLPDLRRIAPGSWRDPSSVTLGRESHPEF
jgi:hypothetical protein